MVKRNGKTISEFALEVSGTLGRFDERFNESFRRITGVEEGISKLDMKLDAFKTDLAEHTKEEYVRFDKLEDSIKAARGEIETVGTKVTNPSVSLRTLAGMLVAAIGAVATITYLADIWLHP